MCLFFFFFNDTATTEIYTTRHTLSLHDALPIYRGAGDVAVRRGGSAAECRSGLVARRCLSLHVLLRRRIDRIDPHDDCRDVVQPTMPIGLGDQRVHLV